MAGSRSGPRRRAAAGAAVLVALGAGAGAAAWGAGVFTAAGPPGSERTGLPAPATQVVVRRDITATTPVAATLGYAGSYTVVGQGGGTLTRLPRPGQVIRQGQALYRTGNASPVALLYGRVPAWRALGDGVTGADVAQLNHGLVRLRYASRADIAAAGWDYYSAETAYAVQRLEGHLGVTYPSGSLALGQVVFEPGAIRVTRLAGAGRPGVRAGADGDLQPAGGAGCAGCLPGAGGPRG